MVGGVASGLAAYLGVDVVVVRIAFVVLAFVPFPGFGLLVYGAMLLLVPAAEDGETVIGRTSERGAGFYVGLALVGLATFWLFGAVVAGFGMFGGGGRGGLLPLLLIGLGVALWVDADRRRASRTAGDAPAWSPPAGPVWSPAASAAPTSAAPTSAAPTYAAPTTPAGSDVTDPVGPPAGPGSGGSAPAWSPPAAGAPGSHDPGGPRDPGGPQGPGGGGPAGPGPAPVWQAPPPRERPRSPLGRVTVGLALLAGGIAWLVDVTTAWRVSPSATLAIVLAVLGLGLLVGSVAGRARWLALLVAFLLPVTFAAAAVEDLGIEVSDGVGSRFVTLTTVDELTEPYRMGAGELEIDLAGIDDPGGERLNASVGAGELTVLIPEGAGLLGSFRVEVGEVDVLGSSSAGFSIDRDVEVEAEPGMPTYLMDVRVGAGAIQVRTVPPAWDDDPLDGDLSLDDDLLTEDDAVLDDEPTEEVAP
jgi:phage shock protein PspC (stress-responsive transcriptional regulator)